MTSRDGASPKISSNYRHHFSKGRTGKNEAVERSMNNMTEEQRKNLGMTGAFMGFLALLPTIQEAFKKTILGDKMFEEDKSAIRSLIDTMRAIVVEFEEKISAYETKISSYQDDIRDKDIQIEDLQQEISELKKNSKKKPGRPKKKR